MDRDATWRLIYYFDAEAVAILEVFSKKTKTTPRRVIDTCKKRGGPMLYTGIDLPKRTVVIATVLRSLG